MPIKIPHERKMDESFAMHTAKLTPAEYAKEGGTRCPFCLSRDIGGGRLDAEGRAAWGDVTCNACHTSWRDEYVLTGYDQGDEEGPTT